MLTSMRSKLIVHLYAIEARIVSNFIDRFQMMASNRLSMEVDRTRRRLLDFGAGAADLIEHGQIMMLVGNSRTLITFAAELFLCDSAR